MIDFIYSVKSLIKIDQIHTDNNVFKLHYKFTVIMLIIFSILLTSKQYFGEPISCNVGSTESGMKEIIELFCWIHGTYIVSSSLSDTRLPGVSNEYDYAKWGNRVSRYVGDSLRTDSSSHVIWQKYYQWVCIIFCFQALLFYIPRYIWKSWEGGRVKLLVDDLRGPLVTPTWNLEAKNKLVRYLLNGRNSHTLYACRFTICEIINLANVIFQIYFMDWFLNGKFSIYGIAMSTVHNFSPMDEVFPKITKCKYFNYGPSGTKQNIDSLCILPLNVLNEKLFLILWFWLYILTALTVLGLIYRLCIICSPCIRAYLLLGHSRYLGRKQTMALIRELSYGDFFVLHNVGSNVNPIIFHELIEGIFEYMKNNKRIYKAHTAIIDM
ncbi:innexin inx2-like [Harmonia axyridis]|uniref:innexin inx2-like n=1 Tax=Harmonia axyridis TaxID=115357 RepID=UPI001E278447|nr:innexin inx2-like [Harmonia axyridis]